MKKIFAVALGAAFCCSQAFAFDVSPTQINSGVKSNKKVQVNSDFIRKVFSNKSFSTGIEVISVTEDGNRLSSAMGELSSPLQGDIVESALNYVLDNSALFNLPKTRDVEMLRPVKVSQENNGIKHVTFQMVLDGVEVHEAKIELHINADNVVRLAHGSLPEVNEISNQIVLGKYQAIGQARVAIKANKFRAVPSAELKIFPTTRGEAKMVYVTRLSVEEPIGDYEVIVDAETGDVLYMNNEMNFATGRGAVYVTNPTDCDVTEEPLYNLTSHNPTGKFAKIVNEDTSESMNEDDVHIYEPNNTHFDEINMYNYINAVHDFYTTLGLTALDRPMQATVHLGDNYDNAYFSPWQNAFAFGDGSRFNDLAKEASIAYHEYSHAAINTIISLTYSAESGAINEGQADYFACSITNDSKLGEWAVAKMGKPFLRNVENTLHYPEDIHGEVHADGKIWGAVLWDIRKAVGKAVADKLIFRSHHYLKSGRATFMDAYNALIAADAEEFGGKNAEALHKVMAGRGIGAASYNGAVLTADDLGSMKKFMEVHNEL